MSTDPKSPWNTQQTLVAVPKVPQPNIAHSTYVPVSHSSTLLFSCCCDWINQLVLARRSVNNLTTYH
ncbi:hypothetical protein P691DRAFT_805261 [Macrolepiota fuliginosa MF-IS2]|uniref:Uncharacterized protein n=1 Tax=Macrolepiota fuliginosa MF-IS2 TaxID=1400762 RepID=A0A9P6C1V6_9AGAR|nr:hypothetical protein P691DRAFT_805261 [Macrolepiota fuliginosa MF-IS2]